MRKHRVLVLTSTFPRWNSDTDPPFVYELCKKLTSNFEIHVLAPHCEGTQTFEQRDEMYIHRFRYAPRKWEVLAYNGGMLHNLRKRKFNLLLVVPFFLGQLGCLLRLQLKYKYSLIHAHWIIPQGVVAACTGLPFILTSHGGDLFALNKNWQKGIKRWVLNRASLITVVSHTMKLACEALVGKNANINIAPMGIDTSKFSPPQPAHESRQGILYVGRLVDKKGVSILVEALSLLHRHGTKPHLTIIGDGPKRLEVVSLVQQLNLKQHISFLGALPNSELASYYRQAEIFVLPSIIASNGDQEGLGLVTLEAMASGCPVIASSLEAVKDVVKHGETGLLTKPGDPDELAKCIYTLLNDQALRQRLSLAAQQRANDFDWEAVAKSYGAMINSVIHPTGNDQMAPYSMASNSAHKGKE